MAFRTIAEIVPGKGLVKHTQTTEMDRHRMQDMLENRSAPMGHTDDTWLRGFGTLDKQYDGDPEGLQSVIDGAKKRGFTPNPNSVYVPQLAQEVGDPRAFVNGPSDIKKVCEDRNLDCRPATAGAPSHTRIRKEPQAKKPHLAPDIAERMVGRMVEKNPDLKRVDKRDLIAEANRIHAPKGK